MLNEDIVLTLLDHNLYLGTNGVQGNPAMFLNSVLSGFDFSGMDLTKVNFDYANMRGCNFFNCNIKDARLDKADLTDTRNILRWQSPIGSRRMCYSVRQDVGIMHKIGCFWGDTEDAIANITKRYGRHTMYEDIVRLYAICLLEGDDRYDQRRT